MPASTAYLWHAVSLFDGLRSHAEPMSVLVENGRISRLWPAAQCNPSDFPHAQLLGTGGTLTPGLVDCHTHLVYAGNRAHEFALRQAGASYSEIAAAGGGILSTVHATRAASESALIEASMPRLDALLADGVTRVEIKSGYGLSLADELKMLHAAKALGQLRNVHIHTTLLAAHALPPEYQGRADAYIEQVCDVMIPAAAEAGLASAVDVFCEGIGFNLAQCERVYRAAQRHGLAIKAHAEQLTNLHGSALAARYQALSVDHLEYLDEAGVAAMAEHGTVAVLLPGAFHTLRETQLPPIALLRQYGVPMAVASDANPGTSPLCMPTLHLNLACVLFGLTPDEALAGMTAYAARALGLPEHGQIAAGQSAELCWWAAHSPAELAYAVQPNRLRQRMLDGVLCDAQ
ncbi:imidazolonepropionase [Atopomonas hussainii]|uniref:Imidazolonepropionase n=1 Tax=Atopomonas hussainii TaxID=1429083 RepID=A0A1H7SXU8_9GAMM|nr:imidazolonepropionase [Atopomonas hussainii]